MKTTSILAIAVVAVIVAGGAYGYQHYQRSQEIAQLQRTLDFYSLHIERNNEKVAAIKRVSSTLFDHAGTPEFPKAVSEAINELLKAGVVLNYSEDYQKVSEELASQQQKFAKTAVTEYDLVDDITKKLSAAR